MFNITTITILTIYTITTIIADIIIPDLDLPGRGLGEDLGDSDGARPLVAAPLWIYQLSKVITD